MMSVFIILLIILILIIVALLDKKEITGRGETKSRRIIHVAGVPGSGKTYIGNILGKKLKTPVFDIDDIINYNKINNNAYSLIKQGDEKSYEEAEKIFSSLLRSHIKTLIDDEKNQNKDIIFVGWPEISVAFDRIYIVALDDLVTEKYYIDIDMDTLMTRVVKRDFFEPICKNPKYLKKVISGESYIQGIDRIQQEKFVKWARNWYQNQQYEFLTQKEIMIKILKKKDFISQKDLTEQILQNQ
jgi:adenylate kinase family enzyme